MGIETAIIGGLSSLGGGSALAGAGTLLGAGGSYLSQRQNRKQAEKANEMQRLNVSRLVRTFSNMEIKRLR
jgi:hypothetical protein